ncbi:polysaccharide pyruvyl transferase family protein [Candidatus Saccharibacteria bacterium]|nr:polysaccharide pyruvyl transferase family protein [Candidatus Saccharibacteria bacterium]
MTTQVKYGLFCYDTQNIGDEIQSLAAKRFLPRVDYYINRDNIDDTVPPTKQKIKIIMNGWYLDPSIKDGKSYWPPFSPSLQPLLISIHINSRNGSTKLFSSQESVDFLKKFTPVGARDLSTYEYLQSLGIPSYFSGCLTLTLLPDKNVKKSNFILAAGISDELYQEIKSRTKRPIIRLDTLHSGSPSNEVRFKLAQYWLTLYQSAHCIITTKLHVILPGLALGTPVIAISGKEPARYAGLIDLANHYTEESFIKDKTISLDRPLKNPTTFTKLRDELVKTCSAYTGYDSQKSYLDNTTLDKLRNDLSLIEFLTNSVSDAYHEHHAVEYLKNELIKLEKIAAESEENKNPGVKRATKLLVHSVKRYLGKKIK